MSTPLMFAFDLAAISLLVFGLYVPRHRRKDLVVAYLGVNVGVLAVANALAATEVSAGLGLGLFGVLSIIRLRSSELDQYEVAYFFAALALGLLGGIEVTPSWMTPACMGLVVGAIYIADHPRLLTRYRRHTMILDRAFTDEHELATYLQEVLGGRIRQVTVRKVDMVRDTTYVDVRYELPAGLPRRPDAPADDEAHAVAHQ